MKFTKLLKVFAKSAIALTFAALAFSCAGNVSDASVSDSNAKTQSMNIAVSNYNDLVETSKNIVANRVATSSSARTIIADSFDLSGITLYLYGTSTAGTTYGPTKVIAKYDDSKKTVGKVAIPAESKNWNFTLYAVDSGDETDYSEKTTSDLLAAAVLVGYSSMDMTNGDTAKFTLSPDGLTKTSNVSLSLTLDNWELPDDYSATAGIYLLTTGADATISGNGIGTATINSTLALDKTTAVSYKVVSMTPGTYLFKVTFTNSKTGKTFYWSDVIIVLPGKELSASIAIPNVIGTKPDTPGSFIAGYIENSEDKYLGYYTVDFEWARPLNKNENYYEIDVLEFSDNVSVTTLPSNDDDWSGFVSPSTGSATATSTTYAGVSEAYADTLSIAPIKVYSFVASDVYEDGSLLGGNKAAQFRLELGKRYWARIRAVNDAGSSAYKYFAISNSDTFTNTTAKKFSSDTINRYRISYNVNGGNYYTSTSEITTKPTSGAKSDNIVAYFCQESSTGNDVIQGNGTTVCNSNYYLYKYGDYTWAYWNYYKDGVATKYEDSSNVLIIRNKGYANLDLYAVYTGDASVEVDDKSAYDILYTWISYKLGDSGTETTLTAGQKTVKFDIDTETSATWTFKPLEVTGSKITSDFTFDKVNFTVSKGGVTYTSQEASNVGPSGTIFSQSLSGLSSGVYNVLFTAHTGTTTVSYPITLTIAK